MKKGRAMWCPPSILDEIENIKQEEGIESNAEAMRKLGKYSQVGRTIVIGGDRKQHLPIGRRIKHGFEI